VPYQAVIFDLGGVVLGSPLHAIDRYEQHLELPRNSINRVVADSAPTGAWSRLERGELSRQEFYPAFERDCERAGFEICARTMFEWMSAESIPRTAMLDAIQTIRQRGLRVAALTNNWESDESADASAEAGDAEGALRHHFDAYIESCVVGMRKPDPRIYQLVCSRLAVEPAAAIFLDDIGANLKPARELGLMTIKVSDPFEALDALERVLGFPLQARTEEPA
jgi:epoxide hydrolase-like predicted phosphatase